MTIAFLCPGQGAQATVDLEMLESNQAARAVLDAFRRVVGTGVRDILGDEELMHLNRYAQPLVCALGLANFAAMEDGEFEVSTLAGYSVGELTAYGCAGSLGAEEAIELARLRAELMDEAQTAPGGLLAVSGLPEDLITALAQTCGVHIAIRNGLSRFVVGGMLDSVEQMLAVCLRRGANVVLLPISVASHTPLMSGAAEKFREALIRANFRDPRRPVLGGTTGLPVRTAAAAIDGLVEQMHSTINWGGCMETLLEGGHAAIFELLPGAQLSRMVGAVEGARNIRAMADFRTVNGALEWLKTRNSVES